MIFNFVHQEVSYYGGDVKLKGILKMNVYFS